MMVPSGRWMTSQQEKKIYMWLTNGLEDEGR
jgi:hypothetical protein